MKTSVIVLICLSVLITSSQNCILSNVAHFHLFFARFVIGRMKKEVVKVHLIVLDFLDCFSKSITNIRTIRSSLPTWSQNRNWENCDRLDCLDCLGHIDAMKLIKRTLRVSHLTPIVKLEMRKDYLTWLSWHWQVQQDNQDNQENHCLHVFKFPFLYFCHDCNFSVYARTRDWTGLFLEPLRMDRHTLSRSQSVVGGQAGSSYTVVRRTTDRLTTR